MKPSDRAKAICEAFGIAPQYEDYGGILVDHIEAAEREGWNACLKRYGVDPDITDREIQQAYDDWNASRETE